MTGGSHYDQQLYNPTPLPLLARHAAAVALLIFAESRRGRNLDEDVCLHQGLPPCYRLWRGRSESTQPKKRAAAAAENAAGGGPFVVGGSSGRGGPTCGRLVDFDPLFAPAEETGRTPLVARRPRGRRADRRELFRRRKRIQDRQQQKVSSEQAAADADRAAAELIAEMRRGRGQGEEEEEEQEEGALRRPRSRNRSPTLARIPRRATALTQLRAGEERRRSATRRGVARAGARAPFRRPRVAAPRNHLRRQGRGRRRRRGDARGLRRRVVVQRPPRSIPTTAARRTRRRRAPRDADDEDAHDDDAAAAAPRRGSAGNGHLGGGRHPRGLARDGRADAAVACARGARPPGPTLPAWPPRTRRVG